MTNLARRRLLRACRLEPAGALRCPLEDVRIADDLEIGPLQADVLDATLLALEA